VHPIALNEATPSAIDESADTSARPDTPHDQSVQDSSGQRAQLVVGTNAVTRSLEEGSLRVGVVCLTAKPAFLHRHLLQLAATRQVPMVALPHLSPTISPLLGVKSSLAIGIKVCLEYIPYSGKFSWGPIFADGQSPKFSWFNFRGCAHSCPFHTVHTCFADSCLSAKTTKIRPHENFLLYGIYMVQLVITICIIVTNPGIATFSILL
jgi:ribosomal protein L7Ae-like RNA K-turn-binding protein